jgi:hypothetical protein
MAQRKVRKGAWAGIADDGSERPLWIEQQKLSFIVEYLDF